MTQISPLLLDTKLLYIFVEIYRQKSVSEAAQVLELTQPAVSIALRHLRTHFDNPLFTRVGHEMQGTELAHALYPKFEEAIAHLQNAFYFKEDFDPTSANVNFSMMMSDIGDMILLPSLLALSQEKASLVGFNMSSSPKNLKEKMQQGVLDLAVGYFPELEAGFYRKRLVNQYYVGLVRANHPRLSLMKSDSMSYFSEKHIEVVNNGSDSSLLEEELSAMSQKRYIALKLSNHLGLPRLLLSSDFVATIPEILAEQLCKEQNLEMFALPFECYSYPIYAYWHEKRHKDSDHIWLREILFKAAETESQKLIK